MAQPMFQNPVAGPAPPGYFRRTIDGLWNAFNLLNMNAVNDAARRAEVVAQRAQIEVDIENRMQQREIQRREAELLILEHRGALRAYLKYHTRGKIIDEHYEQYVTRLAEAYFERVHIVNPREKNIILEDVLPIHRRDKLSEEPLFMQDELMIARANYINRLQRGERISYPWWNFFRPHIVKLEDYSGNAHSPYFVPERPNFWKYGMMVSGVVIITLTGRYAISRVCSSPTTGIIIPSVAKLPPLPSSTDMLQNVLTSTIRTSSAVYTGISDLTCVILESGPIKNMLTACGLAPKEEPISTVSMIIGWMAR